MQGTRLERIDSFERLDTLARIPKSVDSFKGVLSTPVDSFTGKVMMFTRVWKVSILSRVSSLSRVDPQGSSKDAFPFKSVDPVLRGQMSILSKVSILSRVSKGSGRRVLILLSRSSKCRSFQECRASFQGCRFFVILSRMLMILSRVSILSKVRSILSKVPILSRVEQGCRSFQGC